MKLFKEYSEPHNRLTELRQIKEKTNENECEIIETQVKMNNLK